MPRTSVRDRVLAIEKGTASENTIIKARYLPDVKGVNRYKHFFSPQFDQPSSSGEESKASTLPYLIRPGTIHYLDNQSSMNLQNSVEKIRKTPKLYLPQLDSMPSATVATTTMTSCNGGFGLTKKMRRAMDIVDQIDRQTKDASEKAARIDRQQSKSDDTLTSTVASSASSTTINANRSRPHAHSHNTLTGIGVAMKIQKLPKRTFAQLGVRQNGAILNQPLSTNLSVGLPNRSVSDQHLEAKSGGIVKSKEAQIPRSQSSKDTREYKDMATQTIIPRSSKSEEAADIIGRSTQTEAVPIVIVPRRKSEMPIKLDDLEEREALFGVIEDALGETFDRYSRIRMNQIIANSARKQAQIWRDAKDFMANQLLPQSIQLANKSKSRHLTAAEIVANIKTYP